MGALRWNRYLSTSRNQTPWGILGRSRILLHLVGTCPRNEASPATPPTGAERHGVLSKTGEVTCDEGTAVTKAFHPVECRKPWFSSSETRGFLYRFSLKTIPGQASNGPPHESLPFPSVDLGAFKRRKAGT